MVLAPRIDVCVEAACRPAQAGFPATGKVGMMCAGSAVIVWLGFTPGLAGRTGPAQTIRFRLPKTRSS